MGAQVRFGSGSVRSVRLKVVPGQAVVGVMLCFVCFDTAFNARSMTTLGV